MTLTGSTSTNSISVNSLVLSGDVVLTINAGQTLTVTSGVILVTGTSSGATIIGGGTLALGAEGIVIASGGASTGSAVTINDAISGTNLTFSSSGGTVTGAGGVTLGAGSAYTGSTTMAGAAVTLSVAAALPNASALNLVSGTFKANASQTLAGVVTFLGSMNPVSFTGTNSFVFTNTVNLNGTADLVSVSNTGGTTFSGQVVGAATLAKQGAATLFFPNTGTASTFSGPTIILGGNLNSGNTGLGGTASVTTTNGGTLQLQTTGTAGVTVSRPLFLNGSGSQSAVVINGTIATGTFTLTVSGLTTQAINATLTGAALATDIQNKLNTLLGAGNTVTPSGSTYTIAFAAGLGTPLVFLTPTGVTGGSITYGNGALEFVSGPNLTWSGAITLASSTAIGVDSINNILAQSAAISGPGDLNKVGNGTLALNQGNTYTGQTSINAGIVTINSSAAALGSIVGGTVVNSGATLQAIAVGGIFAAETLSLNGTGAPALNNAGAFVATQNTNMPGNIVVNTGSSIGVNVGLTLTLNGVVSGTDLNVFGGGTLALGNRTTNTGVTTINATTLLLTANGAVAASSSLVLNPNATLTLDNSGSNVNLADRIGDTTGLTLNGAIVNYLGAGFGLVGLSSSERLGPITIGTGQSTLTSTDGPASSTVQLTASSLAQCRRGG